MSAQNTDLYKVAIGNGVAWGTAVDLTGAGVGKLMYATSLDPAATFNLFTPRDIGFGGQRKSLKRLGINVPITFSCDLTYEQMWIQIVYAFLGAQSAPVEQTGGEGDYLHVGSLQDNTEIIQTMVWTPEDDEVIEIPSIKWNQISFTLPAADVGTFTANGTANVIVDNANAVNSFADIATLGFPVSFYEPVCIGGANHYFRIDDYSDSIALTNADDKEIISATITLTRSFFTQYSLRGAQTFNTPLPRDQAQIVGTLEFTLDEIDSSVLDGITEWLNNDTKKQAEIFIDGSQIGAGVNRSFKWQFPYLQPMASMPSNYGIQGANVFPTPVFSYDMLKAETAAAGITATDYMTFSAITERATSYLA